MKSSPAGHTQFWLSLVCFSFLFSLTAVAQDKVWRPIDPADLASKTPVVEPDADAEALFWDVWVDGSSEGKLSRNNYVRLKIYTERGREKFSKFDIPYFKGNKIKDLYARVIRPDGSIVEVKDADIFERDIARANGQKLKAKSFAVPNIEIGVILEYRFKEEYPNSAPIGMHLEFEQDIPVRQLSYYYKPFGGKEPKYKAFNVPDIKFVKDKDGYWLTSRTNVPAFRDEPRMPPADAVRQWILLTPPYTALIDFQSSLDDYSYSTIKRDTSNPAKFWGSVGAENSRYTKFMNEGGGDIKKTAVALTAGLTSPEEKLRKLYEFCQNEIRNTTYDPSLTAEMREKLPSVNSIGDVLKRKSGSANYIDMLFGSMAHSIGFETGIVLTGDRRDLFFSPEMMSVELVHFASAAVKVGSDWKFFDPGVKFLPYGMLVWFEEDTYGMVIGDKDFSWRQTPLSEPERSVKDRKANLQLNDDGSLEGDVTVEISGHPAISYRMENYDETAIKREQILANEVKSQINAAEVSNISIENVMDSSKPLVEKYHVRVPNYAQRTGKRLFLQPNFFSYGLGPVFSSSSRKYDIFFAYPWSENDEIEIKLPGGFDLDNADAPADVADPRKIGELTVRIVADRANNVLKYSRKFHFGGGGGTLFESHMYPPLKGLFDSFHSSNTHTITLKQK